MRVENAIGALKKRYQILRKSTPYVAKKMAAVVYVCVVLHNFLLDRGDIVAEDNHNVFDSDSEDEDEVPAQYEPGTREDVLQLRETLKEFWWNRRHSDKLLAWN